MISAEYGMGAKVSKQGDVYSFGVLLLEIFTGRRPTDEMFNDSGNLHSFVKHALPDRAMDVVDQSALFEEEPGDLTDKIYWENGFKTKIGECLVSLLGLGVVCSEEAPETRITASKVVADLVSIRSNLSKYAAVQKRVQ